MPGYRFEQLERPQGTACYQARTSVFPLWPFFLVPFVIAYLRFDSLFFRVLAAVAAVVFLVSVWRAIVVEETFTLDASLGLSLSTARALVVSLFPLSVLFPADESEFVRLPLVRKGRLVPLSQLRSVHVAEGLQGAEGRYYLAAVREKETMGGEKERENILPRREDLEQVWKASQALLPSLS
ncbi:hypothetical protein JCM8097_002056 [Rhodosporidiobolus ruineniae]